MTLRWAIGSIFSRSRSVQSARVQHATARVTAHHPGVTALVIFVAAILAIQPIAADDRCLPPGDPQLIRVASIGPDIFESAVEPARDTMMVLSSLMKGYDLIALGNLSDPGQERLRSLMLLVNDNRECYRMLQSKPVRRRGTTYVFVYNAFRLNPAGRAYKFIATRDAHRRRLEPDLEDRVIEELYDWEPYFAYFETFDGNLDFAVMNNRITEEATQWELDRLPLLATEAVTTYGDPDVLVLGDLIISNPETLDFPDEAFSAIAAPLPEKGRSADQLRRMFITSAMEPEFTGEAGVLRFGEYYTENPGVKPLHPAHDVRILYAKFALDEDQD